MGQCFVMLFLNFSPFVHYNFYWSKGGIGTFSKNEIIYILHVFYIIWIYFKNIWFYNKIALCKFLKICLSIEKVGEGAVVKYLGLPRDDFRF